VTLSFSVYGVAQPAGSKRAFVLKRRDGSIVTRGPNGPPVVNTVDANPKAKSWKQEIASAAAKAMEGVALFVGPVRLQVCFIMPRPQGHFGSGKNAGKVKPKAPRFHTVKPDVTKLVRGLEDALTGIVWRDDSQVAETSQSKVYGEQARVDVIVKELKEEADLPTPVWGSTASNS
jgi:Holliday junction resolvase RusA-like endonuclease